MTRPDEHDIIGTKPVRDETKGLGLFDAVTTAEAEREITEDFVSPPRAKPTLHAPGAGQLARMEARERAARGTEDAYRRIVEALEQHGPMTRKELAEATGMPTGTINGRIAEMRMLPAGDAARVVTHGRRNGESVCHLERLLQGAA